MTELEKAYADLYRFNQKKGLKNLIITAIRKKGFRHICYLRWYQSGHCRIIARLLLRWSTNTTGLDIHFNTSIGPGFVLHHPFNIAINGRAVLGKNVSLHHGCTIGAELRGKRAGNPTLGDNVWVGSNACIVGEVHIGNDVLIAPLTYVNFDVPDHSIVIGNPGRIIAKEHATEGYISNENEIIS